MGNIQTDQRIYEEDVNYIYSYPGMQNSGTGLPENIYKLEKINGGVLELNKSITIKNTLALTQGNILLKDGFDINLTELAKISGDDIVDTSGVTKISGFENFSEDNMIIIEDENSELRKYFYKIIIYPLEIIFPIGSETGGEIVYTPVHLNIANSSNTSSPNIAITMDDIKHPNNNYTTTNYLKRYWRLDFSNMIPNYDIDLYYDDVDVRGNEKRIHTAYWPEDAAEWNDFGILDFNSNHISIDGLNDSGGDFTGIDFTNAGVLLDLKVFLQGAYR